MTKCAATMSVPVSYVAGGFTISLYDSALYANFGGGVPAGMVKGPRLGLKGCGAAARRAFHAFCKPKPVMHIACCASSWLPIVYVSSALCQQQRGIECCTQ